MKQASRILASLAFATFFAIELSSCEPENTANPNSMTAAAPGPLNEVDVLINEYEKSANAYRKVAKKLKDGDVSVTVRYIDMGKELRAWPAKLQQVAGKMTPEQAKRAAAIETSAALYLQK